MVVSYTGGGTIWFRGDLLGTTSTSSVTTSQDLDITYTYAEYSTDGVVNRNGGIGIGSFGGFDIGPHVLFKITNGLYSQMLFYLGSSQGNDTIGYKEIKIEAIRGDDSNGGDQPNLNKNLTVSYRLSGSYSSNIFGTILEHDSSDGTSGTVVRTLTLPEEAQTDQGVFITIDHYDNTAGIKGEYGVKSVVLVADEVERPPITTTTVTEVPAGLTVGFSYSGSGSLPRASGTDLGKLSYSYTPSSIVPFIYVDLGTLGAPTATIDHGSVTEPTTGQEDWGDMRYDQQTRFPFGVVRLASSTTFVVKKVFVGSGQLFELGEAFTRLQAPWIVEGTISLRGEANTAFLYRYDTSGGPSVYGDAAASYSTQYSGSGSLFSGSFTGEAKATVYPEQPDYTHIEPIYVSAAELHSTYNPVYRATEFIPASGTGTGSQGGFAIGPHVRFGTVNDPDLDDGFSDERTVRYYDVDLTNVVRLNFHIIKGSGSNGGEQPDNGEDLLIEVHKANSNQSILTRISYGGNTSDHTLTTKTFNLEPNYTDYQTAAGDIKVSQRNWSGTYEYDHYGLAGITFDTRVGVGDTRKTLFGVSGDALVLSSLRHIGSGTLFNIGSTQPLRTFGYSGSGILFGFGNESRRLTYSYPGTDFFTYEDYGQVAASTTQPNEDFGSLFRDPGDDVYEVFDRGEILVNYTKSPFGLFKLRSETIGAKLTHITGTGTLFNLGDADSRGPQNHYGEGSFTISGASKTNFLLQEFGSGLISTLSGAAETITASPDQEHKLLDFTGFAGQSRSATPAIEGLDVKVQGAGLARFIPRYNGRVHLDIDGGLVTEKVALAHLGTGVLFDFIGAEERRVYSYNTSSIDFITHPDYGSVADAAAIFDDYGDLDLRYTGETGWMSTPDIRVDYHYVLDNYTNYPFGIFPLKGEAHASKSFEYIASGPLFVVTGAVELRFPPFHAGDVHFVAYGEVKENRSKSYIGLQSLQISGEKAESFTPSPEIVSGSIFAIGGAAESKTSDEVFNTLFEITGASSEVRTRGYQGTGSIFSNGILSESVAKTFPLTPDYTAYLTLTAEDLNNQTLTTVTPAVEYTTSGNAAFDIGPHFRFGVSGTGASYEGASGDRTVAFTLDLRQVKELTLNIVKGNNSNGGNAPECFGDSGDDLYYEINSGGETLLVSACNTSFETLNSVTISVPVADRVPNSRVVVHQKYHSGSTLDVWALQSVQYIINGVGDQRKTLFDITGDGEFRRTKAHQGSGTLFGLSGAVESTTVDEVFATLFNISGASAEVRTRGYEGTGVISTLSGSAESFTASPDDLFSLFDFTGSVVDKTSKSYQGFGTIFGLSGASESVGANPPDITTDIVISGFASESRVRGYQGFVHTEIFSTNVVEKATFDYVGSGVVSAFSGGAEVTTQAFGSDRVLLDFRGTSVEKFIANPPDIRTDINIFGSASARINPRFNGYGVFYVDVEHVERVSFAHYGSGDLFTFSSQEEAVVYSYNNSSIDFFIPVDLGLVTLSASTPAEPIALYPETDFGTLDLAYTGERGWFSTPDDRQDWHYILDNYTRYPFGLFEKFNGAVVARFARVITLAEDISAAGTIRISGESANNVTPNFNGSGEIRVLGSAESERVGFAEGFNVLFEIHGAIAQKFTAAEQAFGKIILSANAGVSFTGATTQDATIFIIGASAEIRTRGYQGTGFISTLSGAAESFTGNPVERQILFDITGQSVLRATKAHEGSGTLFGLSGAAESTTVDEVFATLLTVSGEAVIVSARGYQGTGRISTLSGIAESFTASPDDLFSLFDFTGVVSDRTSKGFVGSGTLFGLSGAVESTTVDEVFNTLFDITGASSQSRTRGYQGSGRISTLSGAAESFTVNPTERELLFSVSGLATQSFSFATYSAEGNISISGQLAKTSLRTFAEQPEVQARISGAGKESYVPNWNGSGRISTLFGTAESVTFNTRVPGPLFSISGFATQAFSFGNFDADSAARIFGEVSLPPTLVYAESGFGTFTVSGEGEYAHINVHSGFGTIFSKGVGGESLTRRIPAFQADLALSGFAAKRATFNPPDITTRIQTSGEIAVPIRTFSEVFRVEIFVSGEATEKRTNTFEGDGSLFAVGFGGESISRKLPAFQADMFVSGFADQRATFRETFFGSLFTFSGSSAPELLTFAEQPEVQIRIDDESTNSSTNVYIGTGRISTLSGAAEAATFNPLERELLFSFGGGFSDIKIVKAETKQIEISIDVDTDVRFIPNWIVEGTIPVSGIAHTTRSIVHTGEGFISTLSGVAESFTYNPTEDTALFSFLGIATIRSAVSEVKTIHTSIFAEDVKVLVVKFFVGSGIIPVSGRKDERTAKVYEGTGVISTLSGSAESFTANPDDVTGLFDILGIADTKPIKVFTKIGSGALFSRFGAGEARSISVPINVPSQESKGLFKLDGTAPESFTIPYEGFGSLFSFEGLEERRTFAHQSEGTVTVSGVASTQRTRDYEGFGSLFSFIEAESAVRFIPSTRTVLFDITGESVFRTTQAHEGKGSLFTSFTAGQSRTYKLPQHLVPNLIFKGAATIKNTYQYQGQNHLEITGSAQESFTSTVYERDVRLKTSGNASQRFVATEESQGGTIKVRGTATFLITNAFQTYTLFDIVGIANVAKSAAFAGSGTIFTFINGKEIQPDKGYQGSGTITLRGESVDTKVSVAPERTYGWII